jgi:hypothetical protein
VVTTVGPFFLFIKGLAVDLATKELFFVPRVIFHSAESTLARRVTRHPPATHTFLFGVKEENQQDKNKGASTFYIE